MFIMVTGTIEADQSAHPCISWENLFWIFRDAWRMVSFSFCSTLVGCSGLLPFQASSYQVTPDTSQDPQDRGRVAAGQVDGDEEVQAWLLERVEARSSVVSGWQSKNLHRLGAQAVFLLQTSPASPSTVLFYHPLYFSWEFSSPLVDGNTTFKFLCAVLVSEANVQFGIVQLVKQSKNNKGKVTNLQEVFKTHQKSCSRCTLKYK